MEFNSLYFLFILFHIFHFLYFPLLHLHLCMKLIFLIEAHRLRKAFFIVFCNQFLVFALMSPCNIYLFLDDCYFIQNPVINTSCTYYKYLNINDYRFAGRNNPSIIFCKEEKILNKNTVIGTPYIENIYFNKSLKGWSYGSGKLLLQPTNEKSRLYQSQAHAC